VPHWLFTLQCEAQMAALARWTTLLALSFVLLLMIRVLTL
jgi:hypothetical protein